MALGVDTVHEKKDLFQKGVWLRTGSMTQA